jgi:hypothetical protein
MSVLFYLFSKIKWSAFIRNPDGHTSELRCALPIHVLAPSLAEEARLATSGSRSLLFGPSGALIPASANIHQVDLPSYQSHVHDRIASADIPYSGATYTPAPWATTMLPTPTQTPIGSPTPSRPGSPTGRMPVSFSVPSSPTLPSVFDPSAENSSANRFQTWVPEGGGEVDWSADLELLSSLSNPPQSRPPSRPGSPSRGTDSASPSTTVPPSDAPVASSSTDLSHLPRPPLSSNSSSSSSKHSFFHLAMPKSRRRVRSGFGEQTFATSPHSVSSHPSIQPLTELSSRSVSFTNLSMAQLHQQSRGGDGDYFPSQQPLGEQQQQSGRAPQRPRPGPRSSSVSNFTTISGSYHQGASSFPESASMPSSPPLFGNSDDILARVPPYDVAARGFLGGGVVPISMSLPSYEETDGTSLAASVGGGTGGGGCDGGEPSSPRPRTSIAGSTRSTAST